MTDGRILSKLRRGLAILPTMLMIAIAALWADSYRHRWERPLACGSVVSGNWAINVLAAGNRADYTIGADHQWRLSGDYWFNARTGAGYLQLAYTDRVRSEARIPRRSVSFFGVNYEQIRCQIESYNLSDDDSFVVVSYRSRGIATPLWPLFVLCAIHSWFFLVRGPLRRRHRCKHIQCLACGYDVSQSPDRCPECGTPSKPSLSPSAADH